MPATPAAPALSGGQDSSAGTSAGPAAAPVTTAVAAGGTSLFDVRLGRAAGLVRAGGPQTALPVRKLTSVDTKGASGAAFQLDQDKLAGQRVNVRRIVDPDRGEGLELNFKLRSDHQIRAVLGGLRAAGAEKGRFRLTPKEVDADGRLVLRPTGKTVDGKSGSFLKSEGSDVLLEGDAIRLVGDGFELDLLDDQAPYASRGKARLRVFGQDDTQLKQMIERAKQTTGLGPALAASDPDSEAKLVRARLLWQTDPKLAQELHLADIQRTPLASLDAWCRARGISAEEVAGAQVTEVFPGHLSVVNPAQGKRYKELGVDYLFAGVGSLEGTLSVLTSDGLMSSEERMSRGVLVTGVSTWQDFRTGGADYVFTRMVTEDAVGTKLSAAPFAGNYQIAYRPEVLARTDWFAYPKDQYGNTSDPGKFLERKYGEELVGSMRKSSGYARSNEVMFQRGLSNADIAHVFTQSEDKRQTLIEALKQAGLHELGGKPVEDAVVVRQQMLDITPERLARFVARGLEELSLAFTPELDSFLRTAIEKQGSAEKTLEAINARMQSTREAFGALQELARSTQLELPTVHYDPDRLVARVREAFSAVCLTVNPELEAALRRLSPEKLSPGDLMAKLSMLAWNPPDGVLERIAEAAGSPPLTAVIDADEVVRRFAEALPRARLLMTPELETFLRELSASAKLEGRALGDAARTLTYSDPAEYLMALGSQAGLTLPKLRLDEPAVLSDLRTHFAKHHVRVTPEVLTLVKQGIEAGEVSLLRRLSGLAGSSEAPHAVAAELAKDLGREAPRLRLTAAHVEERIEVALSQRFLLSTPETAPFAAALAQAVDVPTLRRVLRELPSRGFAELAPQLEAAAVPVPAWPLDEAKVREEIGKALARAYIDPPTLLDAVVEAARKGADVVQMHIALSYLPGGKLGTFAERHLSPLGIALPEVKVDVEGLRKRVEKRFEASALKLTPKVKAFLDEALPKVTLEQASSMNDAKLNWSPPDVLIERIANLTGVPKPAG